MEITLYIIGATALIYFFLKVGNHPPSKRYKQLWGPIIALLFAIIGVYIAYEITVESMAGTLDWGQIEAYAGIVIALGFSAIFGVVKMAINEGGRIFSGKKKGQEAPKLSKFNIAYKVNEDKEVVLKKEWVFPALFFKYLNWAVFVIFVLLFILKTIAFLQLIDDFSVNMPALTPLALIVLLEIYWYLQFPRTEQQEAEKQPPALVDDSIERNYLALWEEYQEVWPDQVLLAWHYPNTQFESHPPTATPIIEAQNLIHAGYKLTVDDYHILEKLAHRSDLLIDDVMSDKVAPLIFAVLLRRLMDGENILILTAKRCYTNSAYHLKIVEWVNEWFFKLTSNRDFWRVQLFSKSEDVEMESRIIVTSADDILEKKIVNHPWFSNLRTVLFLKGDKIFSESLTSNNILLNILRDEYGRIQSIVLSDYREAMQSSVMRNLDVQRDLEEIRLNRPKPVHCFTLFWKLDGDQLFQHKILSGHIEKFLGAEAVLTLLARREKVENIELAGQEQLPYFEYLEELDNNAGSLLPSPVPRHTLKDKAVKEVATNPVSFLMTQRHNSFILARDTDYNAVTTLRKWESYAEENAFVHIVCPPYLLRTYFIDNVEYFSRTPIYALSSKMMISRFEVARTLLERMVIQEISEKEILEELHGINTNAIFVKEELHGLFKLAFGIDIIASNYLNINAVHEFSKEEDRFVEMTNYRLLPRITEDLRLNFLKNVEIIDQARNVLQIISLDLLFQNYLPDQTHAFNGKPYNIRGFDKLNSKLRSNHQSPERCISYRPNLEITLKNLEKPLTKSHIKKPSANVEIELCEGTFDVRTKGYFSFLDGISLTPDEYNYTETGRAEVPQRHYQLGRVAILTFKAPPHSDVAKVTATLSLLLNELMPSLFPDTHQYILVGSPVNELTYKGKFRQLFPTILVADQKPAISENYVQILIFEDAHQDLGLLQSIFDKWDYILRIIDDYLFWLHFDPHESHSLNATAFNRPAFDKFQFLKYGMDELPEFIDLDGTAHLLRTALGKNYMTSEREGFYG